MIDVKVDAVIGRERPFWMDALFLSGADFKME
jgi:hypothetical protein